MKAVSDGEMAMMEGTASRSPHDVRACKIERFKKQRAAQGRIKELAKLEQQIRRGGGSGLDEEDVREMRLLSISTAIIDAVDSIVSLKQVGLACVCWLHSQ